MSKLVFDIPNRYGATDVSSVWRPTVDTLKTGDGYIVRFDLPGVDPESVDIAVEDNVLTVKGERVKKFEPTVVDEWHTEANYGKFARKFELPKGVNSDEIRAAYQFGVLELRIPLVVKPAARKIPVTLSDSVSKAA